MINIHNLKNCISIKTIDPFKFKFAYFDLKDDYLADKIFFDNKLTVIFGREYHKDNEKYALVCCTIRRRDLNKFVKSMEELEKKALLLGHNDYIDFCNKTIELLNNKM